MLEKINHNIAKHTEYFIVNWAIGNQCNYKCSYCTPILNDGKKNWVPFENVIEFSDKIISHYSKMGKKIVFQFTGGEVTLNKDIIKILSYLKSKGCLTDILSNGSNHLQFWNEIVGLLDYCSLSFHADHCKGEHFFEVINMLQKSVELNVNIMLHPIHFQSCVNIGDKICQSFPNVFVSYQPIIKNLTNSKELIDYRSEQLKKLPELFLNIRMAEIMKNILTILLHSMYLLNTNLNMVTMVL